MAQLEKFPYFQTLKVDADLVSNIWWKKARWIENAFGCTYESLFWFHLYRKIKGLPKYKRKYKPTRKHRILYSAMVLVQIVGDKQPLEIKCKSNASAERVYNEVMQWVNSRKTSFSCKFPADV